MAQAPNTAEIFWSRVAIGRKGECWPWSASVGTNGYGKLRWHGKHVNAHRLAWILTKGKIPAGLYVCHRCDSPSCCNPDHLFLGTQQDNMDDKMAKGRHNPGRGERHAKAVLTWPKVRKIRAEYRKNPKVRLALVKKYGVSEGAIEGIIRNRNWREA